MTPVRDMSLAHPTCQTWVVNEKVQRRSSLKCFALTKRSATSFKDSKVVQCLCGRVLLHEQFLVALVVLVLALHVFGLCALAPFKIKFDEGLTLSVKRVGAAWMALYHQVAFGMMI